jgi:hypothetical protein
LTFSDAEHLAEGRVLFSASAEDPGSGEIRGSVLGIIEADGTALWTKLADQDGKPFSGKIEGLTLDFDDRQKIYFVIDDDDEDTPSRLFHAVVSNDMLNPNASEPIDALKHRTFEVGGLDREGRVDVFPEAAPL